MIYWQNCKREDVLSWRVVLLCTRSSRRLYNAAAAEHWETRIHEEQKRRNCRSWITELFHYLLRAGTIKCCCTFKNVLCMEIETVEMMKAKAQGSCRHFKNLGDLSTLYLFRLNMLTRIAFPAALKPSYTTPPPRVAALEWNRANLIFSKPWAVIVYLLLLPRNTSLATCYLLFIKNGAEGYYNFYTFVWHDDRQSRAKTRKNMHVFLGRFLPWIHSLLCYTTQTSTQIF